jgi:gluconolactonase
MRAVLILLLAIVPAAAQVTGDVPAHRPEAIVDLGTADGLRLVDAQWRSHPADIVDVAHRAPGPDLKPSGPPNRTHDVVPHAGAADFDDSAWEVLPPGTIDARRGSGRLSFVWYRIAVTIPARLGGFDTRGSTVVFETVLDDYAEIWVDGKLPRVLGTAGGAVVKGYNAPNRVVIARDAQPGQRIQLAVFGANGPLSEPPGNFVWIRSATLDFHRPEAIGGGVPVAVEVERLDPAIDAIVPRGAQAERLASGFLFTEGPVWVRDPGFLLFSDPNDNRIYRWTTDGQVSVFRTKSGYAGADVGAYRQPGSNGLALDREGRLTICEHGNRRITRLEKNGQLTVLADRYQGKRLNSPNDLAYRSNGALYFTDPPFGLPKVHDDAGKELPFSGVYRLAPDGTLTLLERALAGPNGIAFSPDEKLLYVGNWDVGRKVIMRYEVAADGRLAHGAVFVDATRVPGDQAWDGLEVDRAGNLYASGPGGVWIVSPAGRHLGTVRLPELPANFAWADADGRTLYLTAPTGLYRMRLGVPGIVR